MVRASASVGPAKASGPNVTVFFKGSRERLAVVPRRGEQTRLQSVIETVTRTSFNYCTALGLQLLLFPVIFHTRLPLSQNLGIGLIFMANSLVGGYVMRRLFNRYHC